MPTSRRLAAHSILTAGLLMAGCQGMTYEIGTSIPPRSSLEAEVTGADAWALVKNEGPGHIEATFDHGDATWAETLTLAAGHGAGRVLHGTRVLHLVTGEEGARVAISAQRATGLRLEAARPEPQGDSGRVE